MRNNINKDILKAKIKYYRDIFEENKNNIKRTWEEINQVMGRNKKQNVDELINKYMVGKVGTLKQICDQFADTFTLEINSIVHKCDMKLMGLDSDEVKLGDIKSLYIPKANRKDIEDIIVKLKKNSPGIDGIRVCDLKKCNLEAAEVLVNIINASLDEGRMPTLLKTAIIRPVYKSGCHNSYQNYRPISILS